MAIALELVNRVVLATQERIPATIEKSAAIANGVKIVCT